MNAALDMITRGMNALGAAAFALVSFCSPAVALVVISALIGWLMLLIWGWTSNQSAIKDVRNQISAHLLSTRLFKDNLAVTFRAQRMIIWHALRLMLHSLRPMVIMAVPFVLIMAQIGLRYQFRPFKPGELIRVTVQLKPVASAADPITREATASTVDYEKRDRMQAALMGVGSRLKLPAGVVHDPHDPCRAVPLGTADWRLRADSVGEKILEFGDAVNAVRVPVVIGEEFGPISSLRGGHWFDRLLYSGEMSIAESSPIESIRIAYPPRSTPIFGYDVHWLVTLFVLSIVFALIIKPFTRVQM
ncbi:MAG: hypothetical protein KF841_03940 [Phycisphaerae bacterium]|nr:hypothetical protein [Phycisphaerae bacterium]